MLRNSKAVRAEDELLVYKRSPIKRALVAGCDDEAPPLGKAKAKSGPVPAKLKGAGKGGKPVKKG